MPAAARRMRKTTAALALGIATLFAAVEYAEARRAGSSGFGSRGNRTYSAPAPTNTAPGTAAPMQRTMTPQPAQGQQAAPAAAARQQQAAQPSRGLFGGMGGALLGGLLMGGLFGMLFGGGLGGFAGFLGLILQVALIGFIAVMVMRFLGARRQQPAAAAAGGARPDLRTSAGGDAGNPFSFGGNGGGNASPAASAPVQAPVMDTPLELEAADFDRFEQMLAEVQEAYGREDYATLRRLATPEAMSFLAEELGELASSGKRNSVSDVKLLQGDLSEAWSEGNDDYATVAMRFSAIDAILDRNSGRVLSGSLEEPQESTELWTFRRQNGGEWVLAAIQGTD
ncbi:MULTISPECIES: TIM44-like domain-containing protein [unclassified Pannonibacter]|uniref:TIM44-like domain-containing protein n=1 Tax=unclassified Pannonibacter TaxID=2627228 RepID=UPI001644D10A|nr:MULTISPECIES: TIM44-like domain-containing protein [unclassified Pannonibacter]